MKPQTQEIIEFLKQNPNAEYGEVAARFNRSRTGISIIARQHAGIIRGTGRPMKPIIVFNGRDKIYSGTGCSAFEDCELCPFEDCQLE